MKIFSDEWWARYGVRTIPVGCADRFLSTTEKQDVKVLRKSQQEWWSMGPLYGGDMGEFDTDDYEFQQNLCNPSNDSTNDLVEMLNRTAK